MDAALRWLALGLFGAVLCVVCDHLHATHGVLTYTSVSWWEQPWWVWPEFFVATLLAVRGAQVLGRDPRGPLRRLVADLVFFCGAYAYTSFAPSEQPTVTLLVLTGAFVVRVLGEGRSRSVVLHSLLLAAVGPLCEAALARAGLFHYLHPDVLGVPRWLPGIYLAAGLATASIGQQLRQSSNAPSA